MTVTFKRSDLFRQDVQAIVNPVNCVGIMGKGLALEFKKRYPRMVEAYEGLCADGWIRLGEVRIVRSGGVPEHIVLFPTKGHWREASKLGMIRLTLQDMNRACIAAGIKSVAMPAVGCGLGGLDWSPVKGMINRELGPSPVAYTVLEPLPELEF